MRAHRLPLTTLLPLVLGLAILAYQGPGHAWARAHAGDALAVACLVGSLGAFTPWSRRFRFVLVALVATCIELAQLGGEATERGAITRLLIGSHFDALDFAYYGTGLLLALALELGADARFVSSQR